MRLIALLFILTATPAVAGVFFKSLDVEKVRVITPSTLEFVLGYASGYENGVLKLSISNVDFGSSESVDCRNADHLACERLTQLFERSKVKVYLNEFEYDSEKFKGQVYVDGKNLEHIMLSEGWYKFDYKQSRNKHLLMLQKEAMCKGKGIWAGYSSSLDEMCNI